MDVPQALGDVVLGRPPRKRAAPADVPAKLRIEFGRQLREARNAAGMSQEALSKVVGIDRSDISKIEAGTRNLSLETMARLATAVELDISVLLTPRASRKK
jgi:ribosome-binding protein aMBF1 (putative translation factor)